MYYNEGCPRRDGGVKRKMVKITDKKLDLLVDRALGLKQYSFKTLCEDCINECKSSNWDVIECGKYTPFVEIEDDIDE